MRVYTVCLEGMEFKANHGCLETEKKNGNIFRVDLSAKYGSRCDSSDDVADSTDYSQIFDTVKEVMTGESVNLLETLSARIADSVAARFPELSCITVKVSKKNPPVDGVCAWSSISTEISRND